MNMEQWRDYNRFFDEASMSALLAIFDKAGIAYLVEQEKEMVDPIYFGRPIEPMFVVKIRPSATVKADQALEMKASSDFEQQEIPEYLKQMEPEELKAILYETDSWNVYDRKMASLILNSPDSSIDKGATISTELSIPLIILSYVLSFIVFVGPFIWYTLCFATKTTNTGRSIPIFGKRTRANGWVIGVIALYNLVNFILKRST